MTETYLEQKARQRKELENFPIFFAFSEDQFEEGLKKFGMTEHDKNLLTRVPGGGFIRTADAEKFVDMVIRHVEEFTAACEADTTGEVGGFLFQAFNYELANHEYICNYDVTPALNALGLTMEQINERPAMVNALALAKQDQHA
jgi:hypothetical protein